MFQEEMGGRRRATFLVLLTPKFAKAKNKFVKAFLKFISKDFEKLMKSLEFFFNNSLMKLFVMVAGAKGGWQHFCNLFCADTHRVNYMVARVYARLRNSM